MTMTEQPATKGEPRTDFSSARLLPSGMISNRRVPIGPPEPPVQEGDDVRVTTDKISGVRPGTPATIVFVPNSPDGVFNLKTRGGAVLSVRRTGFAPN